MPQRLILALDGISYRDIEALQRGVTFTNLLGGRHTRRAFSNGYFPVSRNVSTFPSTSDVAWADIFHEPPLRGYQSTYFSQAANTQTAFNCLTTSTAHEQQMDFQLQSSFLRVLGYVSPKPTFRYEVRRMVKSFLACERPCENFYAYIRTTDDAQHLGSDILPLLCSLDKQLEELRAIYRAREGRELEIVILSDHGNNHVSAGKRVKVRAFLKRAGYRISSSIRGPMDVVLPTVGIESWVEIHNDPTETERLAVLLSHLQGADLVTAVLPGATNHFLVVNRHGERAGIEWNPVTDAYRYEPVVGDPLQYSSVLHTLGEKGRLDSARFARSEDWMAATLQHRYPLALERIVAGHTRVTLNPATILVSLDKNYIHAGWWVHQGSRLVHLGGTHGALDALDSNGVLLANFAPTLDTSTTRVAGLFDGFPGRRELTPSESIARWVPNRASLHTAHAPFDSGNAALH